MAIEKRLIPALLAVALLLPTGSVLADDTPDPAAKAPDVDADEYVEVRVPYAPTSNTIASKLPVDLHHTPAHVGAVTGALLREQDAAVLNDALVNISGMNPQSGSGVHDYFVLRGFNSLDGALILTDGAGEPEVTVYNMYNVAGIEVLKGPGGFLYGANPLSGTVNIIRKQPVPTDLLKVEGSFGSHGTVDGALDWNIADATGNRAFRVNAFWKESDGYRDGKESSQLAINPSLTLRFGDDTTLNFNLEYANAEFVPDSGIPLVDNQIPDVRRENAYESPFDFSDQDVLRFQVDFETRLSPNARLRNKTYHRDLDWNTAGTLFLGATPAAFGGDVFRFLTALDDRQKLSGNQLEWLYDFSTGPIRHQLLAGIEYTRLEDDFSLLNDFTLPTINAFNPVETATAPFYFPFIIGDSTSEVHAPYVIDQIEFSDKFQVQLGARYDKIDTRVDFVANAQEPISGYSRVDSEVSPRVGVIFAPNDSLTLFANAAESFAPIGPRVVGARFLEPEKSEQVEVGAKQRLLGGRMQASLALYQIERQRIPITDQTGFIQQEGDQESEGFEFELAAELQPGLRTFFTYAYTEAELTRFTEFDLQGMPANRSGNDPAFVPEHLANLWVSKSFAGGLGVAGGLRYVSEQFIDEDNAFAIDAYTTVDAAVFYDYQDWRLRLNFKNLTDEEYETRGFGAGSVTPAAPLSVYATIEWRR